MIWFLALVGLALLVASLNRANERDYIRWSKTPEGKAVGERLKAESKGKPYEPKRRFNP